MNTPTNLHTEKKPSASVIREGVFNSELKQAVSSNDKAFYNLLISMVSKDATDLDEFQQYRTPQTKVLDDVEKKFDLVVKPIVGNFDTEVERQCNQYANRGDITAIKLTQELHSQPLAAQNTYNLPNDVISNLEFNAQQKVKQAFLAEQMKEQDNTTDAHSSQRENTLDIETWFNTLKQARVFAKLEGSTHASQNNNLEMIA